MRDQEILIIRFLQKKGVWVKPCLTSCTRINLSSIKVIANVNHETMRIF